MSIRSLIEINHDLVSEDTGLSVALARYARSGSREDAEHLQRYGLRVVGMRHHSSQYIIAGTPDGFPPLYLTEAEGRGRTGVSDEVPGKAPQ